LKQSIAISAQCLACQSEEIQPSAGKQREQLGLSEGSQMPRHLISDAHEWSNEIPTVPIYYVLSSETTAKGTGLEESAGNEDPVELDSSPTFVK
jgi:hypothetical protein